MADKTFEQARLDNELVSGTPGVNQEQINGTEVVGATSSTSQDAGWRFNSLKSWIKLDSDWMSKSTYDANSDGRVDNAERLNDGTNVVTAAQARSHIDDSTIHFTIDDFSTANNVTWSANKISNELGNKANQSSLDGHIADTSNPHSVQHSQLSDGGSYTHTQIDSHLNIGGVTPGNPHGVKHSDLSDKGTNTHAQIDSHISSVGNPHNVSHSQVSPLDQYSHSQIDGHINSSSNPHSVTYTQVGAAPSSHVGDSSHIDSDERDAMNGVSQPLNSGNPFATMADIPQGTGHVIQDEGVDMTQRPNLNFVGPTVTVTDDPTAPSGSATKVEIAASGDVYGPGSSIAGNLAVFSDTSGKQLADATYSMPAGGTIGQVLGKASNSDYDWAWIDQSGGGGIPEAPNDAYGYLRRGTTSNDWVRGSRVYEQLTAPTTPSIGDVWIDTS